MACVEMREDQTSHPGARRHLPCLGRRGVGAHPVAIALGIILPFLPLWYASRGLSEWQIGAVVAAPVAARILFTPPLTQLADRLPGLGHAAALYAALAGVLFAALAVAGDFWAILALSTAAVLLWNTLIPLGDAVILVGVRRQEQVARAVFEPAR